MVGHIMLTSQDSRANMNLTDTPSRSPPRLLSFALQRRQSDGFRQNDTYTTVRQLIRGSGGRCALVRSSRGKLFVIKRPTPSNKTSANVDFGLKEAYMLLENLKPHPNIIRCFDAKMECQGSWKLILDYCGGGDLCEQIKHLNGRLDIWTLPEVFVLHVFVEISQALAYIHHGLQYGGDGRYEQQTPFTQILHRDIKPDNIFLRWTPGKNMPDVVLADFGLAEVAADSKGVSGTPDYYAPEVQGVLDVKSYDYWQYIRLLHEPKLMTAKSDIYSFGQTIYTMTAPDIWTTGKDPQMLRLSDRYRTDGLRDALAWCLQIEPNDRPSAALDPRYGLLPLVDRFRRERDRILRDVGPMPRSYWKQPPPAVM